ncbi:MAG: hypothetical protein ACLR8Y_08685 [Alistipes indistinctus]
MHKPRYKFVLTLLLVLWTAGVLYGSLAPGDDLPPAGWLAMIPYFDKVVHFGFYFGKRCSCCYFSNPAAGAAGLRSRR